MYSRRGKGIRSTRVRPLRRLKKLAISSESRCERQLRWRLFGSIRDRDDNCGELQYPLGLLMNRQIVHGNLFASYAEFLDFASDSLTPETEAKFSRMDQLENYRAPDGDLYLELRYPDIGEVIRWKQTSNPLDTNNSVVGYVPITPQADHPSFAGLSRQPTTGVTAYLQGNPGSTDWWFAVGATAVWSGAGNFGVPAHRTDLTSSGLVELRVFPEPEAMDLPEPTPLLQAQLSEWEPRGSTPYATPVIQHFENSSIVTGRSVGGWGRLNNNPIEAGQQLKLSWDLNLNARQSLGVRGIIGSGNVRDVVLKMQGDVNDLTTFYTENNPGGIVVRSIALDGNTLTAVIEALVNFPGGFDFFVDYGFATNSNGTAGANGSVRLRRLELLPVGIGSATIDSTFTVQ